MAVTLQPIDGGPNYYANNGFTYAANAGWDNPNFFPIGPWEDMLITQSDATRWRDLGWNTAFNITANSDLSLARANGISVIQNADGGILPGTGAETVGLLSADENYSASVASVNNTPNSLQDHRFWWLQNTWTVLANGDIGGVPMAQIMSQQLRTPNGTTRHLDTVSADTYWFTGSKDGGMLSAWGDIYNLGRNMTVDEGARGSHYGDMVDILRSYQQTNPAPIAQFIEDGEPGNAGTDADYITPPELNWAAWSSIIHGAREIIYFNHTFTGSNQSQDNVAQPFYQTIQPGQTISIYNQIKATDALIEKLAPVINSPFALNYVTVNGPHYSFGTLDLTLGGLEVMAKDDNGQFYIFADTRDSETQTNIPATFTIADKNATSVTVVNENRTIPVTNGVFTDTFATGATVHIYEVNDGAASPPPSPPPAAPVIGTGVANSNGSVTLTGTAPGGSTVIVSDGGATALGTATASSTGAWSYTTADLSAGSYVFTATDTTSAGTSTASSPFDVTVPSSSPPSDPPPAAPVIKTGVENSNGSVTLTGTAPAGSTVTVSDGGSTPLGIATASSSGAWTFTTAALAADSYAFTATDSTSAGTSAASNAVDVTVTSSSSSTGSSPPPSGSNLVGNGNFETGTFSNWTVGGNSGLTPVGRQIDIETNGQGGSTYAAKIGSMGADGTLSQTITTTPAQTYTLSFWLQNEASGTQDNDFNATWNGQTLLSLTNAAHSGYTQHTYTVTATGSTSTLEFSAANVPSQWDLDNISLTPAGSTTTAPPAAPVITTGVANSNEFGDLNGHRTGWIDGDGVRRRLDAAWHRDREQQRRLDLHHGRLGSRQLCLHGHRQHVGRDQRRVQRGRCDRN